jgi:hypothetical protein
MATNFSLGESPPGYVLDRPKTRQSQHPLVAIVSTIMALVFIAP